MAAMQQQRRQRRLSTRSLLPLRRLPSLDSGGLFFFLIFSFFFGVSLFPNPVLGEVQAENVDALNIAQTLRVKQTVQRRQAGPSTTTTTKPPPPQRVYKPAIMDNEDLWEGEELVVEEDYEVQEVREEARVLEDLVDDALPDLIDEEDEEKEKEKKQAEVRFAKVLEVDPNANRTRTYEGKYYHPFHQPNIVDEVFHAYRRFRKMKLIRHGHFWMGTNDPRSETGEYPIREVPVRSFYLDIYPVISAFYWAFRAKKQLTRTEAETKGWSWVSEHVVSASTKATYSTEGPRGWLAVKKARWDTPEGPDSDLEDRWTHPAVHLSWEDASLYCMYHGKRLPTEQEWEFASRAGIIAEEYPWGDRWERRRANTWQGKWPHKNTEGDGYKATSPVDAYPPQNSHGLYDLIGNVWEWTHSRYYERVIPRDLQGRMHVLKGGSFVDSVDGKANLAVRNGQRFGQAPDYSASNVGFRCARSAPEVDPKMGVKRDKKPRRPKAYEGKKRKIPKIYRKAKPDKDEL